MFGSAKSFDETEAWIGKELVDEPQPGVDVVEAGWIRRRCETLEFSCPIHEDEKAAKEAGFDGIVAPDTMIWSFLQPAYWKAGDPETKKEDPPKFPPMVMMKVPMPGVAGFATDIEVEWFKPMYVGDRLILSSAKLINLNRKKTRVGDGAFMMFEQTITNQKGEKVAVAKLGLFNFNPA